MVDTTESISVKRIRFGPLLLKEHSTLNLLVALLIRLDSGHGPFRVRDESSCTFNNFSSRSTSF